MKTKLILYALFAVLSIIANIGSQRLFFALGDHFFSIVPLNIMRFATLVVGTGVGFILKYILDRFYIFEADTQGVAEEGKQISLYASTALITTTIFWGTQLSFDFLWSYENSRYIGGVLGLVILLQP